jgi:hypothetical protein
MIKDQKNSIKNQNQQKKRITAKQKKKIQLQMNEAHAHTHSQHENQKLQENTRTVNGHHRRRLINDPKRNLKKHKQTRQN